MKEPLIHFGIIQSHLHINAFFHYHTNSTENGNFFFYFPNLNVDH